MFYVLTSLSRDYVSHCIVGAGVHLQTETIYRQPHLSATSYLSWSGRDEVCSNAVLLIIY